MQGSIINHIMTNSEQPTPTIGMGATICHYTDRTAATVIEVGKNGKTVLIQEDIATRTDTNGMSDSQSYSYISNPDGRKRTVKLLKKGWKVLEGKDSETGRNIYGSGVVFNVRRAYHDYGF